jgi:ankyrin repeat protein
LGGVVELHDLAMNDRVELMSLLLDYDADPNLRDDSGKTALILACQFGKLNAINLLLRSGANPLVQDNQGWTAMNWAGEIEDAHVRLAVLASLRGQ